jgi:hypothetical protein
MNVVQTSHKTALRASFAQMRREGVYARLNLDGCCRSCICFDYDDKWASTPYFWNFAGQGNRLAYDEHDNISSHNHVYFYHNSDEFPAEVRRCIEILREHGFKVEWDENDSTAIKIDLKEAA